MNHWRRQTIKNQLAYIANYMWRESLRNLNAHLTEAEAMRFNSNDYYYLTTIYYMGKPHFSQVAETLKLTKPAISAIVRKLTGLGLVRKEQSDTDRRMYYLTVTDKGRGIVEGDEHLYGRMEALIKQSLQNEEQQAMVERLLSGIVNEMMMQSGGMGEGADDPEI